MVASTTSKMWLGAILVIMLASQHDVDAFNAPRLLAKSSATSSVGYSTVNAALLTTTQRCRNNELVCLRATSESEGDDKKEDELDTESTTTGLFIPGFSDQVAAAAPEETKKKAATPPPPVVKKEAASPKAKAAPVKPAAAAVVKKETPKAVEKSTPPASKSPTIRLPSFGKSEPKPVVPTPPPPPKEEPKKKKEGGGIGLPKLSLPFGQSKPKPPPTPKRSKVEETIAATIGGTLAGAVVGLYADVATDLLMDTDLPAIVPPAALGVAIGAGAYVGANQENFLGTITKFIFGGPVVTVKDSITNKITQTVDDIVSTPTRIKEAAIKKVDDTVDEIKATPGKIADAAKNKVDETVEEIKATPGKIADATKKKVDETVEEIKATPGRIAESVEEAIEDAVEDVVEAVEDAVAVPKKKLNELSEKLGVGVLAKEAPKKVPEPPKPPLQATKKQEPKSFFPAADVKLEVPSFSFPKTPEKKVAAPTPPPPTPPKPVELPKFDLPKIDLPSVPSKPKVVASPPKQQQALLSASFLDSLSSAPKAATPAPKPAPPAKKKKNDPYVFTEAALKEYILKDKPAVTEMDKQQEEERKAKEARDAAIRAARENLFSAKKETKVADVPVVKEKKPTLRIKGASPPLTVQSIKQQAQPKAKKAPKAAAKAKAARVEVPPVKGNPTFSLFGLGGGVTPEPKASKEATTAPKAKSPTLKVGKRKAASAPRGVPTISKWKLNPDKSISGFISGTTAFKEGEPVTTSAIVGDAAADTVVKTKSGSQYFLGEEDTSAGSGGLFGLFGSAPSSAAPKPAPAPVAVTPKGPSAADIAAEKRKQAAQTAAAAAEERKQAQAAAAAERTKAAEERKQAQIEAKRIADEKRKVAAEEAAAKRELQARQRREAQEEKQRQIEAQRAEREAREEERKKNAAARAKEDFSRYQMMVESDKKKLAEDKAKLFGKPKTPQAEEAPAPSQPRPTFSLFGIGGSSPDTKETVVEAAPTPATKPVPAVKAKVPTAPRGVATIDKWTLNSDNTISGFISGSADFKDGAPVTTSPLAGKASSNTLVQTKSRSKYFLGEESSGSEGGGGLFGGLFGGQQEAVSKPAPVEKTTNDPQAARKQAQAAAAAAKKAKQEEARQAAEARKQAQIEAAEAKKSAQEEARRAADAKKQAQIEAAEAKKAKQEEARQAAEAKKQAQLEAAQAKTAAQEEARQAALAEKQRIAEGKKQAQLEAKKKAEETKAARAAKAKLASKPKAEAAPVKSRSPTISLFGLGGGDDKVAPAPAPPAPKVTKKQPPAPAKKQASRGVPTLSGWKLNGDGSISGSISGSPSFRDGERITTSQIANGRIESGSVVKTGSGSQYFLG
mmetsp:Transcript_7386/g.12533  ORF Transcript_7386/g.12533 Transcript_7386/m.12533 type:complete len:1354 (+) Transcript_7386:318-4379(+)